MIKSPKERYELFKIFFSFVLNLILFYVRFRISQTMMHRVLSLKREWSIRPPHVLSIPVDGGNAEAVWRIVDSSHFQNMVESSELLSVIPEVFRTCIE